MIFHLAIDVLLHKKSSLKDRRIRLAVLQITADCPLVAEDALVRGRRVGIRSAAAAVHGFVSVRESRDLRSVLNKDDPVVVGEDAAAIRAGTDRRRNLRAGVFLDARISCDHCALPDNDLGGVDLVAAADGRRELSAACRDLRAVTDLDPHAGILDQLAGVIVVPLRPGRVVQTGVIVPGTDARCVVAAGSIHGRVLDRDVCAQDLQGPVVVLSPVIFVVCRT